ncbi:hypothetical protein HPB50_003177 [Hyalomma asiaticum]|uniref:Uncharacterized protein n=1 Tax=Hyalomma asiaticum TaxID=266040 RepID=A0ACB7RTV0_HYAAI|nr:hypothetical protein HPB50_003177 [Hyalomma asiaticum]
MLETTYRQQGSLQEWRATTKRVTEFLWNVVRPTLPTKKKKGRPQGDIRVLGDCSVPENVRNVLCLGPKFAFEPKVPPAERVALSRSISRFVPEGEQARCVSECIEAFDWEMFFSTLLPHVQGFSFTGHTNVTVRDYVILDNVMNYIRNKEQ